MMKLVLLVLSVCALSVAVNAAEWSISNPRVASILMGIDCTSNHSCIASGDSMIYTNDGFSTLTRQPTASDAAVIYMGLALGNATSGISSGLGFFSVKGSAYYNGSYWAAANVSGLFHASQDAGSIDTRNYFQVGQWAATLAGEGGNGVMFSADGGRTYSKVNWNQQTQARYGSFVTPKNGFVTGGTWPQEEQVTEHLKLVAKGRRVTRITERIALLDSEIYHIPHKILFGFRAPANSMIRTENDEYIGVISQTNDGGKTWSTVYSVHGKQSYYFNAIDCVSASQCWAVAEGIDSNNNPIAYIMATTDGGSTWTTQETIEYGSLIQINMMDANNGWAVGGQHQPGQIAHGQFYQTTDGGKTWTLNGSIINTYIFNVKPINNNLAYAVGAQGQVCSIFKYA